MNASAPSVAARASAVAELNQRELDVLVIGGGVVGAGAALDAATRGFSVVLVEAQDFASGTSSRSTKLIHGGLRYLEMLDFRLVGEARREQSLLLQTLAPHLVRPMPFCYPLRRHVVERAYAAAGIALYEALGHSSGRSRVLPHQRWFSRRALYRVYPGLRRGGFVGGIEFHDAQVDDARLVVNLVRTAVENGSLALSRTRATELIRDGERVVGARLFDLELGEELLVRAKVVVVATGAFPEGGGLIPATEDALALKPSKGIHLVIARDRLKLSSALVTRTERSFFFVIPWGEDHWIVGTTDTPWEHGATQPVANTGDVDYVLAHLNALIAAPLGRDDVVSVHAGLRPLIAARNAQTTKLSREHAVGTPAPGLVVVSGGKYTTYRVMARDAIDAAARALSNDVPASRTESVPLCGAAARDALLRLEALLATRFGIDAKHAAHLVHRYGTLAEEVLAPVASDASLADGVPGAPRYLLAEVHYAVTHEGALHVEDVLRRRLRLDWECSDGGLASLEPVAEVMGELLGWTPAQRTEETEYYSRLVSAELEAERQPSDATAAKVMDELTAPRWVARLSG